MQGSRPPKLNQANAPLHRSVVIQGMVGLAADKATGRKGLARCFEAAQEMGVLLDILGLKHTWKFVIDLAIFAAQQNAIPFANWAAKNAEEGSTEFAQTAVAMLRERAYSSGAEGDAAIGAVVAGALMQALQAGSFDAVATADIELLVQETQSSAGSGAHTRPPAAGIGGAAGESAMPGAQGNGEMAVSVGGQVPPGGEMQQGQGQGQQNALFAQDIEEEANSHFQRIYTSEIQIEAVVQMLKNFKASQDQREQEVFACMIHNLFDEYRFFPRYPERELLITGKLFGSLIQHQLVSSITLGIALRYFLEALRKPLRSNMFKFGMCALEQFKQRLVEWPQYCHHILQITHLRQSHAELIDYIQNALQGRPMVPATEGAAPGAAAPQAATPMQGQASGSQFPLQGPQAGGMPASAMQAGGIAGTPMQASQLDQQLMRAQNPSKPLGDFNLTSGPAAPAPPMPQSGQMAPSTAQVQAPPSAYGGFDAQQPATNSLAGFSQGFGQDAQQQLPSNLQNFASDPRPAAGALGAVGAEAREAAPTVDMRNAAVQQTLSVVSGAFGATTNVDVLMAKQAMVPQPDTAILDKVHFVFNNLSPTNLDQKERDLTAALPEQYVPWLCQYTVLKRAAQEQNYLTLYLQFVDRLDKKLPHLIKGIVKCTVENIKLLLVDEKVTSSSSVRSLLKNLGSWLGMLTLQRNKPILQRELDVRHLLIEAYEQGRLVAVVPFVAKVLENTVNSRIFRPPNPWTMLILAFLAEIHPMNDLRLNIKFEVEVLCKALNLDLKEVRAGSVLKGRTVNKEGNPDWNSRAVDGGLSSLKPLPTVPDSRLMAAAAALGGMSQAGPASHSSMAPAAATSSFGRDSDHAMPSSMPQPQQPAIDQSVHNVNIQSHILISPHLALFLQFPHLVSTVVQSVNQAIKEIVGPVVERSVTIACVTTRELILKDFALEQDETQIKNAAHMMVQNLAGSLALVTSKEPLRHNISTQVRQVLIKAKHEDRQIVMSGIQIDDRIVEEAAIVIAQDNLDLGCNLIEKAATEKAVREVDGHLDMALAGRRKANTRFNEEWVQCQQWMMMLPELLRPKSGAALAQQARVYEDFARLPRERLAAQAAGQQAAAAAAAVPGGAATSDKALRAFEHMPSGSGPAAGAGATMSHPMQQTQDQSRMALEKCAVCLAKAEEIVMRMPQLAAGLLTALPQGHDLQQLLMHSLAIVQQSGNKDEVALAYAQRLFRRIYDNSKFGSSPLGVDFLCSSLTLMAQAEEGKRLPKEMLAWLLLGGENRLNRELTVALVQHRLLNLNTPEYANTMAKGMDMGRGTAVVDTVVWVLQQCLVEKRLISTSDCSALLDALAKVAQNLRKAPDHVVKLLEMARNMARGAQGPGGGGPKAMGATAGMGPGGVGKGKDGAEAAGMQEQVANALDMWTIQVQNNDDRAVLQCMTMMIQQGWLKGDDVSERFFRLLIQVAMERCSAALADSSARPAAAYVQADSLSKMMRFFVSYHDEWSRAASGLPPTTLTKLTLVNKFLAAYVRVMHTMQGQRKTAFNQKPFHHLFLRILADLGELMGEPLIFALADVLQAVQPRMVPAFAFSWLELASHRHFMPKLLQIPKNKGWAPLQRLIVGLFKYLDPHLRTAELTEPIKLLYKGTLRVLLVLLHDFPEFLCEYHANFCDAIPTSCIQLRNLILSAFPRNMTLPDPLMPQLKVDKLADMNKPPTILSNLTGPLASNERYPNLQSDLDHLLRGNPRDGFLQVSLLPPFRPGCCPHCPACGCARHPADVRARVSMRLRVRGCACVHMLARTRMCGMCVKVTHGLGCGGLTGVCRRARTHRTCPTRCCTTTRPRSGAPARATTRHSSTRWSCTWRRR
jgi:CCR4-NOT transcription complex subunit 1